MYEESADPKALVRRWFEEVWNKGREEAIDEAWNNFDFMGMFQQLQK